MNRKGRVTSTDVALLRIVSQVRSLTGAGRQVGLTRDQAVYRVSRLARAFGGPVVASVRGGAAHGRTDLTPLGDRIARGGFDSVELLDARPAVPLERPNLLHGVYRSGPSPEVVLDPQHHLRVAFEGEDGQPVSVVLDPEAIVVARRRFASSARNVLKGRVSRIDRSRGGPVVTLIVRWGRTPLRIALTEEPVRQLGLRAGVPVYLYVKATAVRRVGGLARRPR
jgi:molybdopterin-binding protein/molybdate transport repressor ModE-like protein